MVTEEEIERVARMMKIATTDHREYVEKVHDMLDYFEILDALNPEGEMPVAEVPLEGLREDRHEPFQGGLIRWLKTYRDGYVRSPKMV